MLNDAISDDRDKLIRYIKAHVKKHGTIPHTSLEFYKFVKLLGKGAFGKITLGIHKLTGKYVAIKSIDKANIKDEYSRRKVFQEVYILKKIRHSCVIRLLEVFESEKHFLMVMEYSGGGDLLQYVKKRKRLNEQSSKAIFKQILYALGHCHCRSVLHRDIKLDNVLMDGEGGVKLCDFGVSRMVKKGHTIQEQCGTPAYLAPEIIIDKGYQGFSADIWSLGVLLYAMVQGTVPFKASNITDLHKLILAGEFDFPVDSVSAEVKDLVRRMLVLDPAKRISIPQMLNHPWVADVEKGFGDSEDGEDEEHDLKVGSTFFRQEVLGGLITGHTSGGNENGNINFVNVENLYYRGGAPAENQATNPEEKVTYSDYCALTEDFMTYRIDEDAMEIVTGFGFPRNLVIDSINRGDVNHATAAYYLLVY